MTLPVFRYHPDPLASGSVIASDAVCGCCGAGRGYVYAGPVYSAAGLEGRVCPWCIADGSAHRDLGATFVAAEAFPLDLPAAVVAEISQRTPGYGTRHGAEWPGCCNDATGFLAPEGIAGVRAHRPGLEAGIRSHITYNMRRTGEAATRLLESLDRHAGPTVYLFRCLHCDEYQYHIDVP